MSRHVWLANWFEPQTCEFFMEALELAINCGASYTVGMSFAGYYLETCRQKSGYPPAIGVWTGALRSKHRYSRGKNSENYLLVSVKILKQIALYKWQMSADLEPQLIWDYLQDHPELLTQQNC